MVDNLNNFDLNLLKICISFLQNLKLEFEEKDKEVQGQSNFVKEFQEQAKPASLPELTKAWSELQNKWTEVSNKQDSLTTKYNILSQKWADFKGVFL